jgi:hypothetical protein
VKATMNLCRRGGCVNRAGNVLAIIDDNGELSVVRLDSSHLTLRPICRGVTAASFNEDHDEVNSMVRWLPSCIVTVVQQTNIVLNSKSSL